CSSIAPTWWCRPKTRPPTTHRRPWCCAVGSPPRCRWSPRWSKRTSRSRTAALAWWPLWAPRALAPDAWTTWPWPGCTAPAGAPLSLQPPELGATASPLGRRPTRLQSSLGHDAAQGRPTDPDLLAADEQVARLRHALARGVERPFTVALYLLLRARSCAELER